MLFKYILFVIILVLLLVTSININNNYYLGSAEDNNTKKSSIVKWVNKLQFSEEKIKDLITKVNNLIPDFGPIRQAEMTSLINLAKIENVEPGMLISLRNILSTNKSIEANKIANKYYRDIKDDYLNLYKQDKITINDFFNKFPLPPLLILKIINSFGIKVSKVFFEYAKNNDFEDKEHFLKILKHSDLFEEELIQRIKKDIPNFKTQAELAKEQQEKFGRAISTPDILLLEPTLFEITNPDGSQFQQLIKWIDAKNYTLVNIPFIINSINKQAERYNTQYGPGALIFKYGYTEGITIPQTTILSFL